ncbi:MAG: hypothetical protein MZV64_19890 [Ignavibacteriales bacterium]|nr:hypothetical protein [Ignavibacteriales bacterium]
MTEQGADTALMWNPPFFKQVLSAGDGTRSAADWAICTWARRTGVLHEAGADPRGQRDLRQLSAGDRPGARQFQHRCLCARAHGKLRDRLRRWSGTITTAGRRHSWASPTRTCGNSH